MYIDAAKVVEHFGGPVKLASDLKRHEITNISFKAIQKWRERNRISMERWTQLVALSRALNPGGDPLTLDAYLSKEEIN